MKSNRQLLVSFLIIVVGALLFVTGIGRVHLFDWDEINFAESAREMLITGDYLNVQVNFETFWEKPPIYLENCTKRQLILCKIHQLKRKSSYYIIIIVHINER